MCKIYGIYCRTNLVGGVSRSTQVSGALIMLMGRATMLMLMGALKTRQYMHMVLMLVTCITPNR